MPAPPMQLPCSGGHSPSAATQQPARLLAYRPTGPLSNLTYHNSQHPAGYNTGQRILHAPTRNPCWHAACAGHSSGLTALPMRARWRRTAPKLRAPREPCWCWLVGVAAYGLLGLRGHAQHAQVVVSSAHQQRLGVRAGKAQRQHALLGHVGERPHHAPVLLLPVDARVRAAHRQVLARVVKRHAGAPRVLVRVERLEHFELAQVPQLDTVVRGRRQVVAVLAESQALDGLGVLAKAGHALLLLHLPDADHVLLRPCPQDQAVWVELDGCVCLAD
mmetsp:Transcript_6755/g.16819  ORF Transcript_6755/g.16819 Transcript_6755/m.16819 type:complete len:275 (+) Transcript_6755:219-1043(+)